MSKKNTDTEKKTNTITIEEMVKQSEMRLREQAERRLEKKIAAMKERMADKESRDRQLFILRQQVETLKQEIKVRRESIRELKNEIRAIKPTRKSREQKAAEEMAVQDAKAELAAEQKKLAQG